MKHGFCNLSGCKVFTAHLNGSLDGCCWAILSLVQFLFSLVNNRIAKFSLPEKVACEQALYSGGQRELFSLRIIFFESAEGANFGERSEGKRSEPAVKNESLHVSH